MNKSESLQQVHVGTIGVLREVYRRQLQFSRGTAFKKAAQGHKEENVFLTDLKKQDYPCLIRFAAIAALEVPHEN